MKSLIATIVMLFASVANAQYAMTQFTVVKEEKSTVARATLCLIGDKVAVTCAHGVGSDGTLSAWFRGSGVIKGKALYTNDRNDFAIITLERNPIGMVPVKVGIASVGEKLKIGGFAGSRVNWDYQEGDFVRRIVSTTGGAASVIQGVLPRKGDSGGPVLNSNREIVGVVWGTTKVLDEEDKVILDKCYGTFHEFNSTLQLKLPDNPYWVRYKNVRPYRSMILKLMAADRINQLQEYIKQNKLPVPAHNFGGK